MEGELCGQGTSKYQPLVTWLCDLDETPESLAKKPSTISIWEQCQQEVCLFPSEGPGDLSGVLSDSLALPSINGVSSDCAVVMTYPQLLFKNLDTGFGAKSL